MDSGIICLFQDYLADLSPSEKVALLRRAGAEEVELVESDHLERARTTYDRLPRRQYSGLVKEFRRIFGRNASRALSAFILAGPESPALRSLSGSSREVLHTIGKDFPDSFGEDLSVSERGYISPLHRQLSSWAIDPRNWYLASSSESPIALQSRIWAEFPCVLFENGPIECASAQDPDIELGHLEDILQSTGIYSLWSAGRMGGSAQAVVLDTGVSQQLIGGGVNATSVGGLSPVDGDGHGSAVVSLIQALSPQTTIESVCVTQAYSGGQIWNLTSGLTRLFGRSGSIVNISLGASPEWVRALGGQAAGFRDSMANILTSLASSSNFTISAAGNDGIPDLRWPAAAADSLAVASHNAAFALSSFSNFQPEAKNLILAPGGELRRTDGKVESFGQYGIGLSRELFGTSFSAAIASALSCLLMDCSWFREMQVPSRISLFKNHCRKNEQGLPILNAIDIGAVWPI